MLHTKWRCPISCDAHCASEVHKSTARTPSSGGSPRRIVSGLSTRRLAFQSPKRRHCDGSPQDEKTMESKACDSQKRLFFEYVEPFPAVRASLHPWRGRFSPSRENVFTKGTKKPRFGPIRIFLNFLPQNTCNAVYSGLTYLYTLGDRSSARHSM